MKLSFILTVLFLNFELNAQSIGTLSYGGTGCPKNSLTYALSSGQQELVLDYNRFFVRSGPGTNKSLDRKYCNLAIPVHVPAGYEIALATESEGKALVRATGKATLNVESFFPGTSGIKNTKVFKLGHYNVTIGDSENSIAWSTCGSDTILRMNISATTQKDAALYLNQLRFKLFLRSCK